MKHGFTIFIFCVLNSALWAQPTFPPTVEPDTSYSANSIYREYERLKNTVPGLEVVKEFVSDSFKAKKGIVYSSLGERKLKLDVFQPGYKTKGKRIPILLIHGGGWRTGNPSMHYPLAQKLAMMGYVCITPEYRLSTEALFPAGVQDLKMALRWVVRNAKKYKLDTSRIVAMGHSAGGQLAALLGNTNYNVVFENERMHAINWYPRVSAIVDMDGILAFIHPESGEGDDSKRISSASRWFGYSKTEKPELWRQGSALTYAGKNSVPTLFIASSVERMHAGREDYNKILAEHKIYTEVKTFEGAPHSFPLFQPWFNPMVETIDTFIKKIFPVNK